MNKERKGGWIQTFSGEKMYPLDPRPEEVKIVDIAHALSNLCRFNGHCNEFYSVAEHSCHVFDYLSGKHLDKPGAIDLEIRFSGLMHDSSEAYLLDFPRPLKQSPEFGRAYHDAECELMETIADHFGFPWPFPTIIHDADRRVLATEAHQLMCPLHPDWVNSHAPIRGLQLVPTWTPAKARTEFLARYAAITGERISVNDKWKLWRHDSLNLITD